MAVPVLMPKQGQSVEICIITKWHKNIGEHVKKGEELFSYETDKASFEQEAPADGILLEIFYNEGDEVPVLTNVAVIGEKGEDIGVYKPGIYKQDKYIDSEVKTAKQKEENITSQVIKGKADSGIRKNKDVLISPRARKLAEKLGIYYQNIKGSGPDNRIIEKDIEEAAADQARMTPLATERASAESLTPGGNASGIGGRILYSDLADSEKMESQYYIEEKISNVRRIIAANMHSSLQNSAQLTHHTSAGASKMLHLRKKAKKAFEEGKISENITINDMVCFSVIKALEKHPEANSHFLGDKIRKFNKVHLGFAVDTPRGLMVPVVIGADDLTINELSSRMKTLAEQCRKGNINPELLKSTAGSFTITNLGMYGVEMFTPVINLPQVGILGVNTIINRLADIGNGVLELRPYIGISLTYDHRAIDGAPASVFLRTIKEEIESISIEL